MNTPPYVYAPILDGHDLVDGSYTAHLRSLLNTSTIEHSLDQARNILKYDEHFTRLTNGSYDYYDKVYKGKMMKPFRAPQSFFGQVANYFFVAHPTSVSNIFKTPLEQNKSAHSECIDEISSLVPDDPSFLIRECCPSYVTEMVDESIDINLPWQQLASGIHFLKPSPNATLPARLTYIKLIRGKFERFSRI